MNAVAHADLLTPPIARDAGGDEHAGLHAGFSWQVPERFNIAEVCVHRWARESPDAVAILHDREHGARADITFGTLQRKARRLSNALETLGVRRGDRVAIAMQQRPQTATALMGVFQMGAIAVPMSTSFGAEPLRQRLVDSGAKVAIVDEIAAAAIRKLRARLPELRHVVGVGKAEGRGDISWTEALAQAKPSYEMADTAAGDPALLLYAGSVAGRARGALLPHRAMIGALPGFVAGQNWFLPDGGTFWTPADWAEAGGLWNALLPTLYFGRTIVAWNAHFDAAQAFAFLVRHGVSHAFLAPAVLEAFRRAAPEPRAAWPGLRLRAIASAGDAVSETLHAWCRDKLGVTVNGTFGRLEAHALAGDCGMHLRVDGSAGRGWPARPGSLGRPYPGHRLAVLDDTGREVPPGTVGELAIHPRDVRGERDPALFLGYWNDEAATRAKFAGEPFQSWLRLGDRAWADADGGLWHVGRIEAPAEAVSEAAGATVIPLLAAKAAAQAESAAATGPGEAVSGPSHSRHADDDDIAEYALQGPLPDDEYVETADDED